MRRRGVAGPAIAAGALVFAASLLLRLQNIATALPGGRAQFPPADELYHAKRIAYSASHFPRVLERDPDRGFGGEGMYGHWPPLWDLTAAAISRVGARGSADVLARAAWIPPLLTALLTGLLAAGLARSAGTRAALLAGGVLVFSPPLLGVSRLACIDHHFLEPFLVAGVAGAVIGLRSASRGVAARGLALAAALVVALFVQTTILLGAGVAFLAVLLLDHDDGDAVKAGAIGFGLAAAAVLAYRATRLPDYPDDEWFLGYPHVAALLAAAVGCATLAWARRRQAPVPAIALALLAGGAAACAVPHAAPKFLDGALLFGDPWIKQIEECAPIFGGERGGWVPFLALLGGGALLLVPFAAAAALRRQRARLVVALFALVYTAAALSSRRFSISAAPFLAIAGALVAADLAARGQRLFAAAAALVLLAPGVWGSFPEIVAPSPPAPPSAAPMFRVAQILRERSDGGRVLAPYSWGHLFDVVGRHPVVVDNFGSMSGRRFFDDALRAFLSVGEERMAAYCRRGGIRYVVLENPRRQLAPTLDALGQPWDPWLARAADGAYRLRRMTLATFWWRAYFDEGRARPEAGRWGAPFRSFRLVYRDAERSGDIPPWDGPAVEVWEFVAPGGSPG